MAKNSARVSGNVWGLDSETAYVKWQCNEEEMNKVRKNGNKEAKWRGRKGNVEAWSAELFFQSFGHGVYKLTGFTPSAAVKNARHSSGHG